MKVQMKVQRTMEKDTARTNIMHIKTGQMMIKRYMMEKALVKIQMRVLVKIQTKVLVGVQMTMTKGIVKNLEKIQ